VEWLEDEDVRAPIVPDWPPEEQMSAAFHLYGKVLTFHRIVSPLSFIR
jgi:hypothetical protein